MAIFFLYFPTILKLSKHKYYFLWVFKIRNPGIIRLLNEHIFKLWSKFNPYKIFFSLFNNFFFVLHSTSNHTSNMQCFIEIAAMAFFCPKICLHWSLDKRITLPLKTWKVQNVVWSFLWKKSFLKVQKLFWEKKSMFKKEQGNTKYFL